MKRILSACLEQTQRFEVPENFEAYQRTLERRKVRYKILDKKAEPDGSLTVRLIRDYNHYPVGNYLSELS